VVRNLGLVLDGSIIQVLGEIFVSFLAEFDFVLDGSPFVDGCSGFGITIGVNRSSGRGRCRRFFGFETLNLLSGLLDVLFHN